MAADYSTSAVAVGGCRIRLMRGGAGEPILYLHGASGANWLPFLQKLSNNFDVIAPEHPGFGEVRYARLGSITSTILLISILIVIRSS